MGFFSGLTDLAGPLLGLAGNLGGSAMSAGFSRELQEDQQAYNTGAATTAFNRGKFMFDRSASYNMDMFKRANAFNASQAAMERSFNAEQAAANRDFQQNMRATQWQTAVGDMKAAGLNPMLAYAQGGAGNISGSVASGGRAQATPVHAPGYSVPSSSSGISHGVDFSHGFDSAMSAARTIQEVRNLKESNDLIRAQTVATMASADKYRQDINTGQASAASLYATRDETRARIQTYSHIIDKLDAEVKETYSGADLKKAQEALAGVTSRLEEARIGLTGKEGGLIDAHRALYQVETLLHQLDVNRARNFSNLWEGMIPDQTTRKFYDGARDLGVDAWDFGFKGARSGFDLVKRVYNSARSNATDMFEEGHKWLNPR